MSNCGKYSVDKNRSQITIEEIKPHVAIRMKRIFRQLNESSRPPFSISLTLDVAEDFEWFLQRYPMKATKQSESLIKETAEKSRLRFNLIENTLTKRAQTKIKLLDGELREYQSQAVTAFLNGHRMLIGDDVGLGKTFVALGALTDPKTRPALVVVQSHLVKQWKNHIESKLGVICTEVKTTNPDKEKLVPSDVYITNYHRISGWVDIFCSGAVNSVFFDECQELRRSESNRYEAAKNISNATSYIMGLTATPVYNYGVEMFNVMDCISPGSLGTRTEFLREWCKNDYQGKVQNPNALGSYLREKHLFLRRTRAQVGRELPSLNKIVHEIPYDESEQEKVIDLATKLARKALSGTFVERGQAARELDILLRMATGVAKAKYVCEYVKILLDNNEPVLLAGWHRDVYEVWLEELKEYNPVMFTGSESSKQKDEAKQKLLSGESKLLIMSLRSGAGLDGLQHACKTVVFGELDWSPEVHKQVIGRLRRDGQEDQVTAIYLVCDGGSDPPIVDILGLKSEQAAGINDPSGNKEINISDSKRIKEMARKFLEKRGLSAEEPEKANQSKLDLET